MKFLLNIIKAILFPVRILNNIIYGWFSPSAVVGYAWYSREEYKKVIENSKDELGILVGTYDKWKDTADRTIKEMKDKGWIVIKVKVKSDDLQKWLNKNYLINISENRVKYVNYRLKNS